MDFQTPLTQKPASTQIDGLSYIKNYITREQAAALIDHIDESPWDTGLKRRVQHYGWRYDYKARRVEHSAFLGPLPAWLRGMSENLARRGIFASAPDQVIINEYLPGQGISAHVDCAACFGPIIASLSLGSACIMRFSRQPVRIEKTLAAQSLLVLTGEARGKWTHEIPARKSDLIDGRKQTRSRRLSLTFRTINVGY